MNIVFDVGNVLLRWDPQQLVAEVLPGVDAAVVADQVFGQPHWHALDRGTVARSEVERQARRLTGLSVLDVRRLLDAVPPALKPIGPMVALLDELRDQGVPTYVLSNMPAYIQAEILKSHAFFSDFRGRVFSNELEAIKPEAAIYEHLLNEHELAPGACLFIDDLPGNLDTAERLGLGTLHLPPGADQLVCENVAAQVRKWVAARSAR